jgi:hypothetical protein
MEDRKFDLDLKWGQRKLKKLKKWKTSGWSHDM